jgi:hypothetical protein
MASFDYKQPANRVLVFSLGGATYSEACALSQLGGVTYGSNEMLNERGFIEDVR